MKRPEHSVNIGLPFAESTLPSLAGVDLESTASRIAAWGGNPRLYAWSLSQLALTDESVRSIATVAAWRAGCPGFRDAALDVIPALDGAAAALGVAESDLASFLAGQRTDPFAWPESRRLVATVGGFRGLGGPWIAPPTSAVTVAPGEFRVSTGSQSWKVLADVFGARVSPADGLAVAPPPLPSPAVVAVTSADSYLVRLERR